MEIASREQDGATIIAVAGWLDARTAPDFEAHVLDRLDAGKRRFILDLERAELVTSAGLRAILTVTKRMRGVGGTLVVCGLRGVVKEVFAVSGLDTLIPVRGTPDEALTAV
jgi:anti-anti-sigma factor